MSTSTDRIERQILIKAPRSKVWRAISHAESFGDWFMVSLKGKSFVAGEAIEGQITHPGYEHVTWRIVVDRIEPDHKNNKVTLWAGGVPVCCESRSIYKHLYGESEPGQIADRDHECFIKV